MSEIRPVVAYPHHDLRRGAGEGALRADLSVRVSPRRWRLGRATRCCAYGAARLGVVMIGCPVDRLEVRRRPTGMVVRVIKCLT